MNSLRIGIIGAGAIVESNHLPALSAVTGVTVAWIYDKNPARAQLLSRMYSIPDRQLSSTEEGMKEVDACLLATPYGVRKPYIEQCRSSGKGLIVEKPFAFSVNEHRDICKGFSEWEIAVNFQRRYYGSVAALAKIIRSRIFGVLRSIRFRQGYFTLKGGAGYLSNAQLAGGGVIAESASHILDIILYITGADKVIMKRSGSLFKSGIDFDTLFESELTVGERTIDVQCEISTLRNLDNGLVLEFEQASVSCDLSPDAKIYLRKNNNSPIEFTLGSEPVSGEFSIAAQKVNQAFLIFWQQYALAYQQQQPNATSACGSLLTSAWLEEIYKKIK